MAKRFPKQAAPLLKKRMLTNDQVMVLSGCSCTTIRVDDIYWKALHGIHLFDDDDAISRTLLVELLRFDLPLLADPRYWNIHKLITRFYCENMGRNIDPVADILTLTQGLSEVLQIQIMGRLGIAFEEASDSATFVKVIIQYIFSQLANSNNSDEIRFAAATTLLGMKSPVVGQLLKKNRLTFASVEKAMKTNLLAEWSCAVKFAKLGVLIERNKDQRSGLDDCDDERLILNDEEKALHAMVSKVINDPMLKNYDLNDKKRPYFAVYIYLLKQRGNAKKIALKKGGHYIVPLVDVDDDKSPNYLNKKWYFFRPEFYKVSQEILDFYAQSELIQRTMPGLKANYGTLTLKHRQSLHKTLNKIESSL